MSEQEGPQAPVRGSVVSNFYQYQSAVSEPFAGRVGGAQGREYAVNRGRKYL